MKLGLISDIHGEIDALRRALAILKREAVDMTLCLGDLVEKGDDSEAVVMLIQALEIPCVQGNHDIDAIEYPRRLRLNADPDSEQARKRYLSELSLNFLESLPFVQRYTWEMLRVLAVHGSPARHTEYLFAYSPPTRYKYLARDSNADVILCGHTHEPMHVKAPGTHFFNPGSVCKTQAYGSGTCATLTFPALEFTVFSLETGERTDL